MKTKNLKATCIKDWSLDGVVLYKKGKEYPILEKEYSDHVRGWRYLIPSDGNFKGWFWNGVVPTEYFNLSHLE